VTEQNRSPLDNALDLFVYAPVGLALTAVEELPKFAEKGRAQIQGQITIARLVGQFAVAQGRKQIERRLGANPRPGANGRAADTQARPTSPATGPVPRSGRTAPQPRRQPLEAEVTDSDGGYSKLSGRPDDVTPPAFGVTTTVVPPASGTPASTPPVTRSSPAVPSTSVVPPTSAGPPTSTGPAPSADRLAIPGYDSLSASQVVQRLAGLSRDELEAVGAYESAHRARRTILTRVNQLKG